MLVELKFERDALARAMRRKEAMETFEEGNLAATDQLVEWKKRLEQDENSPSGRVRVRHYVIKRAFEAEPSQVMPATRATGGQGPQSPVLQCRRPMRAVA
jgi:hypothetical protein